MRITVERVASRTPREPYAELEPSHVHSAEASPGRRSRAWVPVVILVVGLVLLLYSMQLGGVTTSGYELQRLQAEGKEWRQRNEQLQLELAKFQSLAWIEIEATRRLGMQRASRVTYLEVRPPMAAPSDAEEAPPAGAVEPHFRFPDVLGLWRAVIAQIAPPLDGGP
jgi:hypothetical protein